MRFNVFNILFYFILNVTFSFGLVANQFQTQFPMTTESEVVLSDIKDDGKWKYIEVLNLNPERYAKHLREAKPIVSGEISAFKAFQEGKERVVSNYIKLDNEEKPMRRIVESEEIVNVETKIISEIIKSVLQDPYSVEFKKSGQEFSVVFNGKQYSLKTLIEFTHFKLIAFADSALDRYHEYIYSDIVRAKPSLPNSPSKPTNEDFIRADPEGLCKNLHLAEKEAINIYTGFEYMYMNSFLRGDFEFLIQEHPEGVNARIRETLLNCAVAISGLNKMADYDPPPNPDGTKPEYVYRGESGTPSSVINMRKQAVEEGGEVTMENAFTSSSYRQPTGFFGEHSNCGIMFKNLKGKKITPLSMFGDAEREVLFPPTHVQWRYYKVITSDEFKKEIPIFLAKPVTAPLGTIPDEIEKSILIE